MNYMNILSDFEIRLRRCLPDTAEQDQIYKLGNQVIEKDMLLEKQSAEIEKLKKKLLKLKPEEKEKPAARKISKPSEFVLEWTKPKTTPATKKKTGRPSKSETVEKESTLKKAPVKKTTVKKAAVKKTTTLKTAREKAPAKKAAKTSTARGRKKAE